MKNNLTAAGLACLLAACSLADEATSVVPAGVRTTAPPAESQPSSRLKLWWKFFFDKPAGTVPQRPIPLHRMSTAELLEAPDGSLWRLGHSSVLYKLQGRFWLTDPVFSERASPVQWAGPKRFHAPPITIDELPPIEAVVISHDHYDHLDHAAILALRTKTSHFVVPRGVGDLLVEWGVDAGQVQQLDWWQGTTVAGVRWTAVPTQHFSGRGLTDANRRLWCAWVIDTGHHRVFFGADSGYFDGFRQIGERFGPFDLTLLENGAYDLRWTAIHMLPEQTVKAHLDLRGRWLLPIHNSSFDLAFHPWQEPLERLLVAARREDVPVSTPRIGERVDIDHPQPGERWWRGVYMAPAAASQPASST